MAWLWDLGPNRENRNPPPTSDRGRRGTQVVHNSTTPIPNFPELAHNLDTSYARAITRLRQEPVRPLPNLLAGPKDRVRLLAFAQSAPATNLGQWVNQWVNLLGPHPSPLSRYPNAQFTPSLTRRSDLITQHSFQR